LPNYAKATLFIFSKKLKFRTLFFHFDFVIFEAQFFNTGRFGEIMARRCQLTGVGPQSGNNVSHAHNRTKRRFLPNLQKKRIWVQELNRFVTLKLTAKAIKTITKNGTAEVAKMIKEKQIKVH
jgi:large subunit ribosomal protein L28